MRWAVLSCVTLFVLAQCVACQCAAKLSPSEMHSIDQFIEKMSKCRNSPGVTLAVVQDGKTVIKKGYGKADLKKNVDVTEKTIFPIASMSKQMTATLMAIILSSSKKDNRVSWKTKVRDILPKFEMASGYMTEKTSLEDIVSHRTGLPENDMMWISGAFPTLDDAQERVQYFDPIFEFRNNFLYNGMTFSVLARVVKELTGLSWEDAMKRHVFEPLNMTSSTFYGKDAIDDPRFAKPYVCEQDSKNPCQQVDQNATSNSGTVGPAGSIATTAEDMSKYMELLVSGGFLPNGTLYMFEDVLNELFKPLAVIPRPWMGGYLELPISPHRRSINDYAHGWMLGTYRDHDVIFHMGNLYGYDGMLALYPDVGSAVFTVVNGPMGRDAVINNLLIHDFIADHLLGEVPWLDQDTVCTYPAPWKKARNENYVGERGPKKLDEKMAPSRPLSDYVGTYGNLAQGNVTILINETTKMLQLNYGDLACWKLFPSGEYNKFSVEVFGPLSFMKEMSTKYIYLAHVQFESLFGNPIEILSVSMFNYGRPPKFYRGLLLSSAKPSKKL